MRLKLHFLAMLSRNESRLQCLSPTYIGHLESNGCFRCHNDKFKAPNGKVISKDCNLCHTIVAQGVTGVINIQELTVHLNSYILLILVMLGKNQIV